METAQGPSHGVADQLLPHVHLISTHRYASHSRLDSQKVVEWLLQAPKIARDTAPFFWTYLDTPADGQIFLTWQPLARLGTDFASDGYIWSGPEVVYSQDLGNGLVLEIYLQKAGFKPGLEPLTLHSRRRFRLTPGKSIPNAPAPQCDMSLWIVQYGPSDPQDRIPVNSVQVDGRTNNTMKFRMQLQSAGHIMRKEFMLADRPNWPTIPLPRLYATPHGPRPPVPQSMAYPPNAGPPSKRGARAHQQHLAQQQQLQQQQQHHPMAGAIGPVLDYDDEEDTARGDLLDHTSPREVSLARYEQNHEWMEELFGSPYRVNQIQMADLGLGLKGELAPLTKGIFEAQGGNASKEIPKKPYIGTLDKDLADEFRKRVAAQIESTTAEIKQLEVEHARAKAHFEARSQLLARAERELRGAVAETGPEFWRLEGRTDGMEESGGGSGHSWGSPLGGKVVDDIVSSVETELRRKTVKVRDVDRVQDGGYQELVIEPPPPPVVSQPQQEGGGLVAASGMSRHPSQAGSQISGVMVGDSDIDMGGTAAGLLDQMHTGMSSTSTPVNSFPTPQPHLSGIPSTAATPAAIQSAPSPHPSAHQQQLQPATIHEDVEMSGTPGAGGAKESTPPTAPDQGTGSGDWVVVPKSAVSAVPSPGMAAMAPVTAHAASGGTPASVGVAGGPSPVSSDAARLLQQQQATPKPTSSAAPTPGGFSSLGDIEGAGDALAGFGATPPVGGADEDDLNMDLVEDSAFGDAFHGVSESRDAAGVGASGGVSSSMSAGAGGGGVGNGSTPHAGDEGL